MILKKNQKSESGSVKGQVESETEKMGNQKSKVENLDEFKQRRQNEFPDEEKSTQETKTETLEEIHDITEDSDDEVAELSPIITRKKPKGKF